MSLTLYPCAKINIGLYVGKTRPDGYHEILTAMVETPVKDKLTVSAEGINASDNEYSGKMPVQIWDEPGLKFRMYGNALSGTGEASTLGSRNIVVKAWRKMKELAESRGFRLPEMEIVLEKSIPDGAGMGGGSADAAYTLLAINNLTGCRFSDDELEKAAAETGSDCPFFIRPGAKIASGTGTVLSPANISLKGLWLVNAKPQGVSVSTREAYAGVNCREAFPDIEKILASGVENWRGNLENDFEASVFPLAPEIRACKEILYEQGADYASMTGSGAAVFGLFSDGQRAEEAASALKSSLIGVYRL